MAAQGYRRTGNGDIVQAPASDMELTSDRFVRGVALALRSQWEGEDHFGIAASSIASCDPGIDLDDGLDDNWGDYRRESETVILAYLDMLRNQGFRIVRDLS
jgi:hypothetical protein